MRITWKTIWRVLPWQHWLLVALFGPVIVLAFSVGCYFAAVIITEAMAH